MDDRDFFSLLYQTWSRTSGAEDCFWMPEQDEETPNFFNLVAVGEEKRKHVASALSDEDADFITAVHGCLPDLIRRLNAALDEADRLDERVDYQTEEIAELVQQVDELTARNRRLIDDSVEKDLELVELQETVEYQREQIEFWRSR